MMKRSLYPNHICNSYIYANSPKQDLEDRLPTSNSVNMTAQNMQSKKKHKKKLTIVQPSKSIKISSSKPISSKYNRIFIHNNKDKNQRLIQNQQLTNQNNSPERRFNKKKNKIFTQNYKEQLIRNKNSDKLVKNKELNKNRRESLNEKQSIIVEKWQKKLQTYPDQQYELPYHLFRNDSHYRLPFLDNINSLQTINHHQTQRISTLDNDYNEQINHLNPVNKKVKPLQTRRKIYNQNNQTKSKAERRFNSMIKAQLKNKCQKAYSNSVGSKISNYNIRESLIGNSLVDRNLKLAQSFLSSELIHQKRYFDEQVHVNPILQKISYRNIDLPNINTEDTQPIDQTPQIRHHHLFSDFQRSAKKQMLKSYNDSPKKQECSEPKQVIFKQILMKQQAKIPKWSVPFILISLVSMILFIQMIG